MKKLIQFVATMALAALVFSSCSGPKNTVAGTDVSRSKFTGNWTLTNVSYDGLLPGAVQTVFDQGPPNAFLGSTWRLTNSGNGIYTLTSGTSQTIYWSINNNDSRGQLFQFKKIYQGDKAQHVDTGYQLIVAANNGTDMTLRSPVTINGGSTGYVVYSFTKAQ